MGPSQRQTIATPIGKRILFASIGSLGDLHPCIALGIELKLRGHIVRFASTPHYRSLIESLGFEFHPIRPNWDPTSGELIARCANLRRGPEILIRELILPHLNSTYEDLVAAARDADFMLAGELNYAAPIVAEKLDLRWASIILSPISFFSAHDPSFLVSAPPLFRLRNAGVAINRAIVDLSRVLSSGWWKPVRALRKREGLRIDCDPLLKDKFSPLLTLALFSRQFAAKQPDWPQNTFQPGFAFYDRPAMEAGLMTNLEAFIAADTESAPIVFTQGSTATHNAGDFYKISAEATRKLRQRAILVGASEKPEQIDSHLLTVSYAPYSWIFPKASVIVHQGGSGTTGQAMLAGRPMLIVPYGWDQPDNALRIERRGSGLHLSRKRYTVSTASNAISRLLSEPGFSQRASVLAEQIAAEDAVTSACDAIERVLA